MRGNYHCVFLRHSFQVGSAGDVVGLHARINYDDGLVMWINGQEVLRTNMPGTTGDPVSINDFALNNHESGAVETFDLPPPGGYLVSGTNVVSVQVFNNQINSSDLVIDLELFDPFGPDTTPPVELTRVPVPGGTVRALGQVEIMFNDSCWMIP